MNDEYKKLLEENKRLKNFIRDKGLFLSEENE